MTEPVHNPTAQAGAGPEGALPLLWVEDDPVLGLGGAVVAGRWLAGADCARSPASASKQEREVPRILYCVAILDMGLPPTPGRPDEGLRLLAELVGRGPAACHCADRPEQAAVGRQAVHAGLFDFLAKPVGMAALQANAAACGVVLRSASRNCWRWGRPYLSVSAELSEGVREASDQVAEQLIRHVLNCNGFNVTAAARIAWPGARAALLPPAKVRHPATGVHRYADGTP